MLRITHDVTTTASTLTIEGQVRGPWVAELRRAVAQAGAPGRAIHVDAAGVRFADSDGTALLRELARQGVTFVRTSPFVDHLLGRDIT